MKIIEVFYKMNDGLYSNLIKMNCTGKWIIVNQEGYEKIFCEHKYFFFLTRWINEDDIVFIETEYHNCKI